MVVVPRARIVRQGTLEHAPKSDLLAYPANLEGLRLVEERIGIGPPHWPSPRPG
jgi:hypothetical protein